MYPEVLQAGTPPRRFRRIAVAGNSCFMRYCAVTAEPVGRSPTNATKDRTDCAVLLALTQWSFFTSGLLVRTRSCSQAPAEQS